ncbi:unnamed protein product, partial [Cladocopium goreaui]
IGVEELRQEDSGSCTGRNRRCYNGQHRRCGGANAARSTARSAQCMCRIFGHSSCCSRTTSSRGVGRRQRSWSTQQKTSVSGASEACVHFLETVKCGREFPVLKNGAHEARPHMFPTCHSVTGERNYLSPIAAVWDAWRLRGEIISQSFDDCSDHSISHHGVPYLQGMSLKSVLCISQEPRNVRRRKRVHFDDCIEVAMSTEDDCLLYSTVVQHGALYDWSDKPWRYSPKPPSRRFSWRKITDLTYPFCNFADIHDRKADIDVVHDDSPHSTPSAVTSVPHDDSLFASPFRDKLKDRGRCAHNECRPEMCFSVLRDITNQNLCDFMSTEGLQVAPLSTKAVLSSLPSQSSSISRVMSQENHVPNAALRENDNIDELSIVQIGSVTPYAFKNSPIEMQQAFQMHGMPGDHAHHMEGVDERHEEYDEGSESPSPGDSSDPVEGHQSANHPERQDVILFHLADQPVRSFLNWNSYEEMMTEIAHHYSRRREEIEEAYEVVVSPPDLGIEVVPVIVHVFGDIPPESNDRLVLVDIEYHAHRIEGHFRSGPTVSRSVQPLPSTASRHDVLYRSNVDRYCRLENGRCLVFINSRRWPDYDLDRKVIAHGDYIRIAVPPSDRFACSTTAISDMTQRGFSDQQILDEIHNEDAASGFSPSLLGEDEMRRLATDAHADTDDFLLMQRSLADNHTDPRFDGGPRSSSSDSDEVLQDWYVDLQRLVEAHFQQCGETQQQDFMFSIYTWFIDQETANLCREPKIAILGEDPAEWREDILLPWEYHLVPDNSVLIDLVQPFVPRASVEEHIAHVIITQRPVNLRSVLFSMEFVDEVESSVIVTFAAAVPNICNARMLADHVPLFDAFFRNKRKWVYPEESENDPTIKTKFGLGIRVQIFPTVLDDASDISDDNSMIQNPSSGCCISARSFHSTSRQPLGGNHSGPMPHIANFSLTEEFIRYVQAVGAQTAQDDAFPDLPEGLSDQPVWVQDLWEKWAETVAQNGGDPQSGLRLETWFTNPRRWTRCEHSRVVVLSSNFQMWERELLGAWHDRAELALPTQFAIVFPTPEDVDRTVQEQLVIEQQSEPFSRTVVVTVCDTFRSYGKHGSIALVVSDQLNIYSLSTLLGYSEICSPEREDNECLLWMGNIAIRPDQTLQVRTGNALRFLVRRGIRVSIPELLSMTDQQLRNELRAAIGGVIFRRPNVQGFPADPHSANNPGSSSSPAHPPASAYPPEWINQLQEVFDRHAFLEHTDEGPVMYVLVWFVQGRVRHFNDSPKVVRIDADNQWWQSELIFPWREQFTRGAPMELHFVDPMPPSHPWQSHAAHVIVVQSLPEEHVAVLATSTEHAESNRPVSQAAMIVHRFSGIGDFVDRMVTSDVPMHSITVRRGRLSFPSDRTVRLGSGDGIVIGMPPVRRRPKVKPATQLLVRILTLQLVVFQISMRQPCHRRMTWMNRKTMT